MMNKPKVVADKQNQLILKEYKKDEGSKWSQKIYFTSFTCTNKLQSTQVFTRQHLRIRINCQDQPIYSLIKVACQIHMNNLNGYFQQFHGIMIYDDQLKIQIQAQPYKYTLANLVEFCLKFSKKLPPSSDSFLIHSLVQIYKYILYLIQTYQSQESYGLIYDLCLQNLAFDSTFRIILINPCISKENKVFSIRAGENKINTNFRKQFIQVLKKIAPYIQNFQDFGLIHNFQQYNPQFCSFQEERKTLQFYENCSKGTEEIPKQLYRFLKQSIENQFYEGSQLTNEMNRIEALKKEEFSERIERYLDE